MKSVIYCGLVAIGLSVAGFASAADVSASARRPLDAKELAKSVVIHRDSFGVPHVDAKTDAAVGFGCAYVQAEDFFWQIEESYIAGIGRHAEIEGKKVLGMDLLNRAFEIVPRSKADFSKLEPAIQDLFEAYALGLNHYLASHPETKPRMITHFEPWMVLAYCRHTGIEIGAGHTGVGKNYRSSDHEEVYKQVGSNAWAIAPQRTKSKNAMLFINPHQPWYGFGQFYETHVRSGEGWSFSGATFFGHPLPSLGYNDFCGWAFTSNEPDIGDAWVEKFDHPTDRLKYRYGEGYRDAVEWKDSVKLRNGSKLETREYTFLKTHHGPVVRKQGQKEMVSIQLAKLYDALLSRMLLKLVRAKSFPEWREGFAMLEFPMFNCVYADRDGNIFYVYNGAVPERDPNFDWSRPVDGSNPNSDWKGIHPLAELPQCLNPPAGFVQSCNNTPYTTSDDGNPQIGDFPRYMVGDLHDDKRRSKMSRKLLREMAGVTFEDVRAAAFDTTVYWAWNELPAYKRDFDALKTRDSALYEKVKPYLEHLLDWDCKVTADSTAASLCQAWYEEMYGAGYPAETLDKKMVVNPDLRFQALVEGAEKLRKMHGDWKVKWGDVHRIQRHTNVADFYKIPFTDRQPSLPLVGAPGPMGVIFTQYCTPSVFVPFVRETRKRYGIVGPTYMAVVEFGKDKVRGETLIQYGSSANPKSPHYFDQAALLSQKKLKATPFYWEDVEKDTKSKYHPGEEAAQSTAKRP